MVLKIDTADAISGCAQADRDDPAKTRFLYQYGGGLHAAKRYTEAMQWFRKAADQGDALAQNGVGLVYAHGQGVTQSYAEAVRWLQMAADRGSAAEGRAAE
jgi:uncharacterized protein